MDEGRREGMVVDERIQFRKIDDTGSYACDAFAVEFEGAGREHTAHHIHFDVGKQRPVVHAVAGSVLERATADLSTLNCNVVPTGASLHRLEHAGIHTRNVCQWYDITSYTHTAAHRLNT